MIRALVSGCILEYRCQESRRERGTQSLVNSRVCYVIVYMAVECLSGVIKMGNIISNRLLKRAV